MKPARLLYLQDRRSDMSYLVCIPEPDVVSRGNCEKIHNILARMSDKYKLNIVPVPVKTKQGVKQDFYRKYYIYKDIKDRDGSGEAYLTAEEEQMILSVCRTPEEEALMKSCTFGYQYPDTLVLKSFREEIKDRKDKKDKKEKKERKTNGTSGQNYQKESDVR